jgi:hypothetical protein
VTTGGVFYSGAAKDMPDMTKETATNNITTPKFDIPGVSWNDDGSANIDLVKPINISGDMTKVLKMQYPSVIFMKTHNKQINELDGENSAIAELCGVAPEEIGQLGWPDYKRAQKVFTRFLAGDAPNWQMPSL